MSQKCNYTMNLFYIYIYIYFLFKVSLMNGVLCRAKAWGEGGGGN